MLDNQPVTLINAFFEEGEEVEEPNSMVENRDQIFQGSIFLGDGFLLTHDDADRMRTSDPRNAEVIMPIINGKELNNEPDQAPGRRIINFHDWSIEHAQEYPEPFSVVEDRVKPEREVQKDKGGRDFWWRFLRPRMKMQSRLHDFPRCFVAARTTKHLSFSATPTDYVFSDALYVFTTDRWDLFTVVQSTLHEVWARKYSGSLKQDLRYSSSKCFNTFGFPAGLWQPYCLSEDPLHKLCAPILEVVPRVERLGGNGRDHKIAVRFPDEGATMPFRKRGSYLNGGCDTLRQHSGELRFFIER